LHSVFLSSNIESLNKNVRALEEFATKEKALLAARKRFAILKP